MAVDTREKRASALTWFTPLPLPDSDVDREDRQQVTWIYAGIDTGIVLRDLTVTVGALQRTRTAGSARRGWAVGALRHDRHAGPARK